MNNIDTTSAPLARRPSALSIRYGVSLVGIVAVALLARSYEIGYNLDGDEVFSLQLGQQPLPGVIEASLRDTPHPPLHNLLLHFWVGLFGASETSVRELSVLLSGAFLVVTYYLLRRALTPATALAMLGLLAISPLFVYYGQQARPYALIALLATLNMLAFLRLAERPAPGRLAAWGVSGALLLYAQYLGILLLGTEVVLAYFTLATYRLRITAVAAAAVAAIVPWVFISMASAISRGTDPIPQISWMEKTNLADWAWYYVSIFGESGYVRVRYLILMILAVLALPLIRGFVDRDGKSLPFGVAHLLFLLLAVAVPAIVIVESIWGPKPIFAGRQMLGSAVAFIAVLGFSLDRTSRPLRVTSTIVLMAWMLAALPAAFPHNAKPPWRAIAQEVTKATPGVPIAASEIWVVGPLSYYVTHERVRFWSDLTLAEMSRRVVFVCRVPKCFDVDVLRSARRQTLIGRWNWDGDHEILAYELASLDSGRLTSWFPREPAFDWRRLAGQAGLPVI